MTNQDAELLTLIAFLLLCCCLGWATNVHADRVFCDRTGKLEVCTEFKDSGEIRRETKENYRGTSR